MLSYAFEIWTKKAKDSSVITETKSAQAQALSRVFFHSIEKMHRLVNVATHDVELILLLLHLYQEE